MNIAPIGLQNFRSNNKQKANTSFGMDLSRTGHITIDMAKAEGKISSGLYETLKHLATIKPNPAPPSTNDILFGCVKFDGSEGPLTATLGTKDARHFKSQEFDTNGYDAAFAWAINPETIKELRAQ